MIPRNKSDTYTTYRRRIVKKSPVSVKDTMRQPYFRHGLIEFSVKCDSSTDPLLQGGAFSSGSFQSSFKAGLSKYFVCTSRQKGSLLERREMEYTSLPPVILCYFFFLSFLDFLIFNMRKSCQALQAPRLKTLALFKTIVVIAPPLFGIIFIERGNQQLFSG